MKEVPPGVHHLRGFPPNAINVYLAEDVLIDAGTKLTAGRVLRQLAGRTVRAHIRPGAEPRVGAQARAAGTGRGTFRTRAAAARHEEVRRLRRLAQRLGSATDTALSRLPCPFDENGTGGGSSALRSLMSA